MDNENKPHWIKDDNHHLAYVIEWYKCSECGEEIHEMPVCMTEPLYKFCPYCGAKMTE